MNHKALVAVMLGLFCATAAETQTHPSVPSGSLLDKDDPLGGRKASELVGKEHHSTGRCDDYCMNACGDFAWGGDTIVECNGCTAGGKSKCFPGAEHYGDAWAGEKAEL